MTARWGLGLGLIGLAGCQALVQDDRALEHPYGDWQVPQSSLPATRVSDTELRFSVPVPAQGQAILTYTIRTKSP